MFLKRLELVGFKSFADRTSLELSPGIVTFVGPNGSGKSNLADAVRWVLGEQSMRAVRGRRSEDVIFAGSASKHALGMAEVSLTLDNADSRVPLPFSEVRITRRLYRSGESEYLLNASRARLKDIVDCMNHVGLSADSYCVIGQGAVDELILQRPEERRGALESAADVRRYQSRLAETRSRLAAAEKNLVRCSDVIAELEPHLKRLKGQADRAERAGWLRVELAGLARRWYRARIIQIEQELRRADEVFGHADRRRAELEALLNSLEGEWREAESRSEACERKLRETRPVMEDLRARHSALQRDLAVGEERLVQVSARLADDQAVRELSARVQQLETEAATAQTAVGAAQEALDAGQQELQAFQQRLAEADAAVAQMEQSIADLERRRARATARAGEIERRLAELGPRQQQAERDAEAAQEDAAQARAALEALQVRDEETRKRFASVQQRMQATEREHQAAVEEQRRLDGGSAELHSKALDMERQAARLEAAVEALRSVSTGSGVDGLPRHARELKIEIDGIVGERLLIPAEYERAIAAALGPAARAWMVGTGTELGSLAIALAGSDGYWALVALEGQARSAPSDFKQLAVRALQGCSVHGFADELVQYPPEVGVLVARYLGRTVIVDDDALVDARARLEAERGLPRPWQVVSVGGSRAGSDGLWLVGDVAVDAVLGRERERKRLVEELEGVRGALGSTLAQLDVSKAAQQAAHGRRQELADEVAVLRTELEQARLKLADVQRQRDGTTAAAERASQRQALATAEGQRVAESAGPGREEIERAREERDAAERQLHAAQSEVRKRRERLALARADVAEAQTRVAVLQAQRGASAELSGRVASEARAARQALDQLRAERERGEQERVRHEQVVADARARLARLEEELAPLAEALRLAEAQREESAGERRRIEGAIAGARTELRAADEGHEAATLSRERTRDELDRVRREAAQVLLDVDDLEGDDWPVQLRLALEETGGRGDGEMGRVGDAEQAEPGTRNAELGTQDDGPETGLDMVEGRRRISVLQRELRTVGAVDAGVLEEYRAMSERHAFLVEQSRDLRETIAELGAAIIELEALMVARFNATFEQVNAAFQATFETLFGGGSAQLVLTQPDSVLETGVEVVARPPGKRLQGLMSLSGGERALTSVALIFALLSVNPTPFVLLDEVDAALDESNVQRFVNLLREYAERIQFLVVTHNRATMEVADALYGVSMEANGASRLLSLRLADAVRVP